MSEFPRPFPDRITLFPRIDSAARFIKNVIRLPKLLSPVSEHFDHWDEDPLASPVLPVTSFPALSDVDREVMFGTIHPLNRWDDMGDYTTPPEAA